MKCEIVFAEFKLMSLGLAKLKDGTHPDENFRNLNAR